MPEGFVSNPELVREDCRVEDLLDFSKLTDSFMERLDSLERTTIVGLVGRYGSGKSTMLYQVQKSREKNEKWINFDAWKYPDRRDLWEGFVLDFADQVGQRKITKRKVDGKDTKSKTLGVILDIVNEISSRLPQTDILDKFSEIFRQSPAKRVFEIQRILAELINRQRTAIVVVVEDVDRSQDAGVYFLETLRQFLSQTDLSQQITVVVPITDEAYNERIHAYMKCFDIIEHFKPDVYDFSRLVREVFKPSEFEGFQDWPGGRGRAWTGENKSTQISSFLETLSRDFRLTIRQIKAILRNADLIYTLQNANGDEPDCRVTVCIEASKHIPIEPTGGESYFEAFKRERVIRNHTTFASFLFAMYQDAPTIYRETPKSDKPVPLKSQHDFKFFPSGGPGGHTKFPSWPWWYSGHFQDDPSGFGVADFYLKY